MHARSRAQRERSAAVIAERARVESLLEAERAAGAGPRMAREGKPAVAARLRDQGVRVADIARLLGVSHTTATNMVKEGRADRPPLRRHAEHDPSLVCRPAFGYGLCELVPGSETAATG